MGKSGYACKWMRLPTRLALLLGMGALSAAGARAEAPDAERAATRSPSVGEMLIRTEGGRVYLSEGGKGFQELQLGDSSQARLVKQLLERRDAGAGGATIPLHPTILAGAGGEGFHWTSPSPSTSAVKPANGARNKAVPPAGTSPPPDPGASRKPTAGRSGDKG